MRDLPLTRALAALMLVILVAVAGASSALADAPPGNCSWPGMSKPFSPWGDSGSYFPAPGGSFEDSTAPWTFSGGAAVVSGNEPFNVGSASDSHSLAIPNGGSATTPLVCVTVNSPSMRLFAVDTGSTSQPLRVYVNYTNSRGKLESEEVTKVSGSASWAPSRQINFLDPISDLLEKQGQANVSFTFKLTSVKSNPGNWQIDDMYIDPVKHH
jgi:hypothetical protein